jgi:hypothetical protein
MSEPKAFPRLLSLLAYRPLPRHNILRVVVWSISNLVNDDSIREVFFSNERWVADFINVAKETTGEIRQQAYRGLWNLAGRNAKTKELKQIQMLINYHAFDLVTKLSYENLYKDQDIVTAVYATGFATEISRLIPTAVIPLFDCPTLFKYISLQLQTSLQLHVKFTLNSTQVVWNALLAFIFVVDDNSSCQQLGEERVQTLGSVLTPSIGLLEFQVNISYILFKLAHYYPTHSMWVRKLPELLETFAQPTLSASRLTRVQQHLLLTIHELISMNPLCQKQFENFEKTNVVEFVNQIRNTQRIQQLKLNPIYFSYDHFRVYEKVAHFAAITAHTRLIEDGEDILKYSVIQLLVSPAYQLHHLPEERQGELIGFILNNVIKTSLWDLEWTLDNVQRWCVEAVSCLSANCDKFWNVNTVEQINK